MKFDANDPRFTAYVLGELDTKERAEVEAILEESAEARALVAELRETAAFVERELRDEACPALDEGRRGAIGRALDGGAPAGAPSRRRPRVRALLAACALLAVTAAIVAAGVMLERIGRIGPATEHGALATRSGAEAQTEAPTDAIRERLAKLGYVKGPAPTTPAADPAQTKLLEDLGYLNEPQTEIGATNRVMTVTPGAPAPQAHRIGPTGGLAQGAEWPLARAEDSRVAGKKVRRYADGAVRLEALGYVDATEEELDEIDRYAYLADLDVEMNTEAYDVIVENPFLEAERDPLSTFSIDVDTASYANMRRFLGQGQLPPRGSVRLEELVNYFSYGDPAPEGSDAFSATLEVAACPWSLDHRLVRIGLKGREIPPEERPPLNLVFLLDVSGSMQPANKLPLVKRAMRMLVERLDGNDRVAIAVYAGASGLVLPSTTANNQATILAALDRLEAGGSTNGGQGIQLAYDVARQHFLERGVNRVILCTDGDFNVGVTDQDSLVRLVEAKAKSGIDLTVLGFGMGNLKDSTLEKLADKGNGNYGYVDTPDEARKLFVEQLTGTLVTIAKDVKIQVEFNPREVGAYRLLGYENRMLAAEDFHDDTKDAGEIGAGHSVTALYEIVPAGLPIPTGKVDDLRYQEKPAPSGQAYSGEMLTLKIRYKEPDSTDRTAAEVYTDANGNGMFDDGEPYVDANGNGRFDGEVIASRLLEFPLTDAGRAYSAASADFKFASAVAAFGMILRDSSYKGQASFDGVLELGGEGIGADPHGRRAEFLDLVRRAAEIARAQGQGTRGR